MSCVHIAPVAAEIFDDIIDGYFPFAESVRQMMVRRSLSAAFISLSHAPMMDIPALAPASPVPLRILKGSVGLVFAMQVLIVQKQDQIMCRGWGDWRWFNDMTKDHAVFDPMTRLAEPAFIRAIGLHQGPNETDLFGSVRFETDSGVAIGHRSKVEIAGEPDFEPWSSAQAWGIFSASDDMIVHRSLDKNTGVKGPILRDILNEQCELRTEHPFILTRPSSAREHAILEHMQAESR